MFLHIFKTEKEEMFAIISVDKSDKKLEHLSLIRPDIRASLYKSFVFINEKDELSLVKSLTLEVFDKYDFTFKLIEFNEEVVKDLFNKCKEYLKANKMRPKKKTYKDITKEDIIKLSKKNDKFIYNFCLMNKIKDKKEIQLVFKRVRSYKKRNINNKRAVKKYNLEKDFNIKYTVLANIEDNVKSDDESIKYDQMTKLYSKKSFTKIVN